jgi:outer membrane usher protein FimD/PapC
MTHTAHRRKATGLAAPLESRHLRRNVIAAAITLLVTQGTFAAQATEHNVGLPAFGTSDLETGQSVSQAPSLDPSPSVLSPLDISPSELASAPSYRERPMPIGAWVAPSMEDGNARVVFPEVQRAPVAAASENSASTKPELLASVDESVAPSAKTVDTGLEPSASVDEPAAPSVNTVDTKPELLASVDEPPAPSANTVELAMLDSKPGAGAKGHAQDLQLASFDENMLRERGLDPKLAEYFREAPHFSAGVTPVTLKVNGIRKGSVNARFDERGRLCVDADLLERGGLVVPEALRAQRAHDAQTASTDIACYDYSLAFPQTIVALSPSDNAVELIVPSQALSAPEAKIEGYTQGGTAALLNYDLMGVDSTGSNSSSRFTQASTEVGFNTADWLFRSRQLYTSLNGKSQWAHLYAYAQHTFVDRKEVFQIGEINLNSTNFPVGALYGVQLFPEQALATPAGSGAVVQGIAQTQARVEVRQLGSLVFSTLVPPGPFTLDNLPIQSSNANLDVTVIEANGSRRQFTVPAGSFMHAGLGAPQGFSAAFGKLQNVGGARGEQAPWLATISNGLALSPNANLTTGALVSSPYQALSLGVDFAPSPSTRINNDLLVSHARGGLQGVQDRVAMNAQLPAGFSANLSATGQTPGFRDLTDVVQATASSRVRTEYSAGLSWGNKDLGSFSAAYTRSTPFASNTVQRVIGSWGRSFKHFSASLNVEHAMGSNGSQFAENQIYANLSIPLGRRSVSAYVNTSGNDTRIGTSYSEHVNDELNYGLTAETDATNHTVVTSANMNLTPRYTQLALNAGRYGANNMQYSAHVIGGVVAHDQGVTLSPYPIRDTFGVVQVGDISGVKVETPSGPTWTDHWGRAIIASMPEYSDSRIQVATKSLPRNVDIKNGVQIVDAGHGSVNHIDFGIVKTRRMLMTTTRPNGQALPKGSTVLDDANQFVTTIGDGGTAFVSNPSIKPNLHVTLADGSSCQLQYSLPEKASVRFYDKVGAMCIAPDTQTGANLN